MSSREGALRQYLAGLGTAAESRVFVSAVPEQFPGPYIWLETRGVQGWGVLRGREPQNFQEFYDIECVASDVATAKAMQLQIRNDLHNHPDGAFGDSTIAGATVTDQLGDYQYRNQAAGTGDGRAIAALDATIYPGG